MRRIWLYSLIAFASLALIGVLAVGVSGALNNGEETRVTQVASPTVADPPDPTAIPEETEEEKENAAEDRAADEQPEEEQAAQEQSWRKIAERREAEDRSAAERRAAEEQAAEELQPAIPTSTALSLTVPSAGIQNDPVTDSVAESVLANGAGKIPSTGFPWQPGANTYIAAHVYGYPGTRSWQQFARVPNMTYGDVIYLTDYNGTVYEYQVSEILTVAPTDVWVVEPTGQTTVSLQTCVGPNWSQRLVVRGTLVGTSQA